MDVDERTYLGEADDFMTVRHLTIRGTNREIGQTIAETMLRRYGTSLADLRGDPPMVRACRDYLRRVYPVHWQRVCGVASAFGIDPEDALTAHTSFYLGETTNQDGTRAERRSPYLHFTLATT